MKLSPLRLHAMLSRGSRPRQAFRPPQAGTTPNTGIGAITLRTMRAKLDEAAAIAGGGRLRGGRPAGALMIALDVEPLAVEANRLLQGLAILSRVVRDARDEPEGLQTSRPALD